MKHSIWIVEDEEQIRIQMQEMINDMNEFECTDEFDSCEQALSKLRTSSFPEIILLDINFPKGMNGAEALLHFKSKTPDSRIVAITGKSLGEYVYSVIKNGATAFLVKPVDSEELELAFRSVLINKLFLSLEATNRIRGILPDTLSAIAKYNFSNHEMKLINNLALGYNKEKIAEIMFLSPNTIHNQINNIYHKVRCPHTSRSCE